MEKTHFQSFLMTNDYFEVCLFTLLAVSLVSFVSFVIKSFGGFFCSTIVYINNILFIYTIVELFFSKILNDTNDK